MCVTDYVQCIKSTVPFFTAGNESARKQTAMPVHGWLYKYLISSVSASSMLFFNFYISTFPSKMLLWIAVECFELLYLEASYTAVSTFFSLYFRIVLITFKCF